MATPEIKLKLSIDDKGFTGTLNTATGQVDTFGTSLTKATARAGASVQSLTGHLSAMGHAAAGALAVGKLVAMTDAFSSLNARVALASQGLGSAAVAQQREIADQARVGVEGLSEVYGTLAKAGAEMGVSQQRVLGIVESLSKAMTLSGGSAESARAALVQFGQGLQAGTLRGEELNSVLEQAPRLAQALAEGLGQPVGALKAMAEQGQITAQAIFIAMERMKGKIDSEFEQLPATVGQAMTVMQNSLLKTIGVFDQAGGVSRGFADGIMTLSRNMDTAVVTAATVGAAYVVLKNSALAATVATQGLALAQGALGGPIGLIATALGVAATAWVTWKATATQSEQTVQAQVAESDADIIKRIQGQIDKLKERNALAGAPIPQGENQTALDAAKRYTDAYTKFQGLMSNTGGMAEATRQELLKVAGKNMAAAYTQYSNLADAMNADAQAKTTNARTAFMASYQSSGDKLAAQIAEYDKQFAGKVSASQRAADIAAIKASGPKGSAPKAVKAEVDEAAKGLALYNDLMAKSEGFTASYAEQMLSLSQAAAKGALSVDEVAQAVAQINAQQPGAVAAAKAIKDARDAADKYIDSLNKSADAVGAQLQKLADEEEALRLSATQNITLAQAIEEVTIRRLEGKRVQELLGGNDLAAQALAREIAARKELARAIGSTEARAATQKSAADAAAEWQKTSDKINDTLTDALMRGFESGKDFAKVLRDTVVNMFKTMVLRPVISAIVNPVSSALMGGMGMSGAANAASGAFSPMSMLGSIMPSATAFGGAMASGFTAALNGGMGMAIEGGMAMIGSATGASSLMAGVGQLAGALGPIALGIGAVAALVKAFDDSGTRHTGGTGSYSADMGIGYGASAYSFGMDPNGEYRQDANQAAGQVAQAVSSIIDTAAVIAGSNKKSFVGTGYADDSSGDGAWGGLMIKLGDQLLTDWGRGGDKWPGREFADGTAGQKQYLDAIAQDVRKAIDTIGLPEWATKYIDALGEGAGLEGLAQALEKIKLTEAAFVTLGEVFPGLTDLSDGAKTALLEVSGGIEALAGTASAYYDNFYTADEKTSRLTSTTSAAFAALGLVMPEVNESMRTNYRLLIESLAATDLSIEANAQAYTGALALQGAVNLLAPTFEATGQSAKDTAEAVIALNKVNQGWQDQLDILTGKETDRSLALRDATDDTTRALMRQVYAQEDLSALAETNQGWQDQLDILTGKETDRSIALRDATDESTRAIMRQVYAQEDLKTALEDRLTGATQGASDAMSAVQRAVDAQRKIYQVQAEAARSLVSEIKGIFDTLDSSIKSLYGQVESTLSAQAGRSFLDNALNTVKATGSLPDSKELSSAISAAVNDSTTYASQAEADFSKLSLAGTLTGLKDVAGVQLTAAEQALSLAESQLEGLDAILQNAQEQLDAANGLNTSVLSIADALREFGTAITALVGVRANQGLATSVAGAPAGGTITLGAASSGSDIKTIQDLYTVNLGRVGDAEGLAFWAEQFLGDGEISAKERQAFAMAALPERRAAATALRSFDVGINRVPYDMEAIIHKDEAIVPAALNPFNPNATQNGVGGVGDTSRLEALVEGLTKEVQRLQSIVNDGNNHARRTAEATNGNPEAPALVQVVA